MGKAPKEGAQTNVTWLWKVPDMRTRVEFARRNAPGDIFTQIARFIVYYVSALLIFVLKPVDYVGRKLFSLAFHVGTVVGFFYVFGLLFFMLLSAVWIPFWALLVGSSWLWLRQPWTRPILLLPGMALSLALTVVLMLVPDPEKHPKYVTITQEWPLTWNLWYPPLVYFEEHNIWNPDVNPYEAERLYEIQQEQRREASRQDAGR